MSALNGRSSLRALTIFPEERHQLPGALQAARQSIGMTRFTTGLFEELNLLRVFVLDHHRL